MLASAYSGESDNRPDPSVGLAVAENALSYPALYDESETDLEWAEKYLGYWSSAVTAHEDEDRREFISQTLAWTTWYQTNDVPDEFEELPEPNTLIESMSSE